MQKVINVLALASFAVSAAVVGAGAYVYVNQDNIKAEIERQVINGVKGAVGGALGRALTSGPALPDPVAGMDETGAVPIPSVPFGM